MLTDIISKIEQAKVVAQAPVDPNDYKVYHGKVGAQRRAKEDLERLFMEYKQEIKHMILFIIVAGNGAKKFADVCEKHRWGFSYDASQFYRDLTHDIDPLNWKGKAFGPGVVDILSRKIEDKADECDVVEHNLILFEHQHAQTIETLEQLTSHVATIFNEQIGVEFVAYDILNKMAIRGVEEKFDGSDMPVLPIVVKVGEDAALAREMLQHFPKLAPGNTFLVTAGVGVPKQLSEIASAKTAKVDKETVVEVLKTINSLRR
jgi:hypothetical protein